MPVVMINGTADPMVPYDGGGVGFTGRRGGVWSVQRTAELFIHANGCKDHAEQPLPVRNAIAITKATEITWSPCRSGKPVTLYRIDGGGHQIAGEQAFMPRLLGESNRDFSAADVILRAFVKEEGSASRL
jgi:polyhydroxybutyrate depolymerase